MGNHNSRHTSSILNFKNTLWNLFFRYVSRFISPRWFLPHVPSNDELTSYTGRLSLEIVSHCWNYSHLMAYNLSAYVNYPPVNIDVTVTVFYSPEDSATVDMLNFFAGINVPGVTWNWQKLPTDQLLRRAIGRNKAALNTQADWIWYIDCDLIFHKGCLDSLATTLLQRKDALLFPKFENVTSLLKDENPILHNANKPKLVDIDTKAFQSNDITRAVGAYQITHGDIARACGYCNNISVYQTPEAHWRKTYEDRTYRWLIRTQGIAIEIPAIYRIRHRSKGRYKKGTLWSKIRSYIRLTKSKMKEFTLDLNINRMPLSFDTPPESLCILRLSAIGDITHVLPIVRTLQSVWTTTKITWIIGKTEAALISDIEGIEFIIFDKNDGWKAYKKLHSTLSGRRFTVLLHMQAALRASIASLMIRADTKIGFDKTRSRDFQYLFTDTSISGVPRVHVIDTFFQFLQTLGINEQVLHWDIPVSKQDIAFAKQALGNKTTLVINPCTSVRANNWRNWDIERYAAVIDYAAINFDLNIVLTGGPAKEEREFGEAIADLAHTQVNNLIGKSSLKQLQAILSAARVVITPDTGPAHMAAAAGVPVIGLYASSNPHRTGPYSSLRWTINKYPQALQKSYQLNEDSATWGKRVRDHNVMELIEINDVTDKLDEIMRLTAYNNTH